MPILENPRHEQFAQHVAAGAPIAKAYTACGYSAGGAKQSSHKLARRPEVAARIAEIRGVISASLEEATIRDVAARVEALQKRWMLMWQVIAARAADPEMREAPGGSTGLLTVTYKHSGRGRPASIPEAPEGGAGQSGRGDLIREYAVDTGLLAEMRKHEEQAARELGQWVEKHDHTSTVTLVERLAAARKRWKREPNPS